MTGIPYIMNARNTPPPSYQTIMVPRQPSKPNVAGITKRMANSTLGKKVRKAALERTGQIIGARLGSARLGRAAGSLVSRVTGSGDYNVHTNSLFRTIPTSRATFAQEGRATRIREREYVGEVLAGPSLVNGSTLFHRSSYSINPTNPELFPWLSRLAHLYDQWEPHGIILEFVSTSSEFNGVSQSLGAIIMATEYDPYDPLYNSKQEMENADFSCSTKPAEGLVHGIECARSERPTKLLYTASSNGAPLTSTQLGIFQLATQGMSTAGSTMGELWISYDISFYKKQLTSELDLEPAFQATGVTTSDLYLGAPNVVYSRRIDLNGDTVRFNNIGYNNKFLLVYSKTWNTADTFTGMAQNNLTWTTTISYGSVTPPNNSMIALRITLTGPGAFLTFPSAVANAGNPWLMIITPVTDSFVF